MVGEWQISRRTGNFFRIFYVLSWPLNHCRTSNIFGLSLNNNSNTYLFVVTTVPTGGLAPLGARPSAGTMMTNLVYMVSGSGIKMGLALDMSWYTTSACNVSQATYHLIPWYQFEYLQISTTVWDQNTNLWSYTYRITTGDGSMDTAMQSDQSTNIFLGCFHLADEFTKVAIILEHTSPEWYSRLYFLIQCRKN